ncbi:MAG: GTPase HflX [Deltaproteobacteria bacterium]|nr:GTPase HflX [Deltaproteobacteria bacterium]
MVDQEPREGGTILVGLYVPDCIPSPEDRLEELGSLVAAAGAEVAHAVWQPAHKPGVPRAAATWIGRGKVEEVAGLVERLDAGMVVFDAELSPAQIRNLEKELGTRVLDRSELILDIFAGRARTRAAVLQVELAQLEYTAPRLRGMWTHLARQAGSGAGFVGSRGPGEKQIEIDRRIVNRRVARLKGEITQIQRRRARAVKARNDFTVGLVGYTNAGKTTLLDALTGAGVGGEDALFATLDTLTRKWTVGDGLDVVLSDTVGFVRDLPHHLVASFRATLEEAVHADLRLHVIDASHPLAIDQMYAVRGVLEELECDPATTVSIINKVDAASPEALEDVRRAAELDAEGGEFLHGGIIEVSAVTGSGLDDLRALVARRAREGWVRIDVEDDASNGRLRAYAHEHGTVRTERFDETSWIAEVELPSRLVSEFERLRAR